MNAVLGTFWLLPQWIWRYFFGGFPFWSAAKCLVDTSDLPFFRLAELTEIRAHRSINLLTLPNKKKIDSQSSKCRDGTVIFFVHGSMANMQQFEYQIDHFSKDGFTVVAFDCFGCGASSKPRCWEAYSHAEIFADLVEVFRRYRGRRNVLVGHSYGTQLAMKLAAQHIPISDSSNAEGDGFGVDALVLIGPGLAPHAYPARTLKVFRRPLWLLELIVPLLRSGFISRALHARTREGRCEVHRRLMARVRAAAGANPMHVCQAFYNQCEWVEAREARGSPAPVLVLAGQDDAITPLTWAQALAEELRKDEGRDVELEVVEAASHQVMQEQPERVNALMHAFLARLRLVPPPSPAS